MERDRVIGSSEKFRLQAEACLEAEGFLTDVVVGTEENFLDEELAAEVITDMTPSEAFLYSALCAEEELLHSGKAGLEERVQRARQVARRLKASFEGHSQSDFGRIFRESEKPITAIVNSDWGDAFFDLIEDMDGEEGATGLIKDSLVDVYLEEKGFFRSFSLMSEDVLQAELQHEAESLAHDRNVIEMTIGDLASDIVLAEMVGAGLVAADHSYSSVFIRRDDHRQVPVLVLMHSRVEVVEGTHSKRSLPSEEYTVGFGGDLLLSNHDLIVDGGRVKEERHADTIGTEHEALLFAWLDSSERAHEQLAALSAEALQRAVKAKIAATITAEY